MFEEFKITEEVATSELFDFAKKFDRKIKNEEEIKDKYPDVIDAMCRGLLDISEEIPVLKLSKPVVNKEGDATITSVSFKTRILASEQRRISTGLNIQKDQVLYLHKSVSFIIGLPLSVLDTFSQADDRVVQQLSTLFM